MKLLLTAFEPFGTDRINSALEVMKQMPGHLENVEIVKCQVPTVFGKSIETVVEAIAQEHPHMILCMGQAGGRFDMTLERVAINVDDAKEKDNEGNQPVDAPIFPSGAPAYFSTLPIKKMAESIREQGIPASVSNSAGTFVCNHLMYGVLHTLAQGYPNVRGGFLHLPFLPCQTLNRRFAPSLSLADMVKGVEAAICGAANDTLCIKDGYPIIENPKPQSTL